MPGESARINGRKGGRPRGTKSPVTRARERAAARVFARNELTEERILEEARRLAFVDLRGFFDAAGNLKPIHALTPDQGAALASMEVIIKNAEAGDGQVDRVHKFKVWDKLKALELLFKRFGMLTERVDVGGAIELTWRDSE